MRPAILAVIAYAIVGGSPAQADEGARVPQPGEKIICKGGRLLEPFVPDTKTAIAIFLAVEAARVPDADKKNFPDVGVLEQGGYWEVFRHGSGLDSSELELEMSKCTGRITRAHVKRPIG